MSSKKKIQGLEALRGIAAIYVVAHHISSNLLGLQNSLIGQPFRFGLEAVLVFFLLSGFVISHSVEKSKKIDWYRYIIHRTRRIYPIFFLALGLSAIVATYRYGQLPRWSDFIGNMLMMQDLPHRPGTWFKPFAENWPLWSLSYEIFFYIIFIPIVQLIPKKMQLVTASVISCSGAIASTWFPNPWANFASFFIIWWAGVEMSREFIKEGLITYRNQFKLITALTPLTIWYALLASHEHWQGGLSSYPIYEFRAFFGTSIALVLTPLATRLPINRIPMLNFFAWLGTISFALYVFHFPIVCLLPQFIDIRFVDISLKILLLFLLSWLAERKLQPFLIRFAT